MSVITVFGVNVNTDALAEKGIESEGGIADEQLFAHLEDSDTINYGNHLVAVEMGFVPARVAERGDDVVAGETATFAGSDPAWPAPPAE